MTSKSKSKKKTRFVSFKVFNSPDYWLDWKYITITHQNTLSIWSSIHYLYGICPRAELCWQRVHGQQLQLVWLSLITKYIFKLVSYKVLVKLLCFSSFRILLRPIFDLPLISLFLNLIIHLIQTNYGSTPFGGGKPVHLCSLYFQTLHPVPLIHWFI